MPAVTFLAEEHHCPEAGTKLYCLVTEAHACEQLAQGCYLEADRSRFKLATFWVASECSTVKAAFHDTDTDILARILADSPDTPTSLRGRVRILARMSINQ